MFIAVVATATASVMYLIGKRLIGRWAGVMAAALFIASPLVQESSARVMSEHLVTLGTLVATLYFARFVRTERTADALAFGAIAAAAILTHGNAWALAFVPGLTVALTNRWYLLRRPAFWAAALPVLVTCVPWYVSAPSIVEGRPGGDASLLAEALPRYAWYVYLAVGPPVLILASIGVFETLIRAKPRAAVAPECAALGALAIAIYILHCILPVPVDSRYMVLLMPSVLLFSAAGVNAAACRLAAFLPTGVAGVGLALILMAVFADGSFALPLKLQNGGYEALVRDVETRVSHVP